MGRQRKCREGLPGRNKHFKDCFWRAERKATSVEERSIEADHYLGGQVLVAVIQKHKINLSGEQAFDRPSAAFLGHSPSV